MTNLIDARPTGPAAPLPPPGATPGGAPRRTPTAVRVLWQVFAGILVVAALVWGPYSVVTLLAHEERVERTSHPAAGITRLQVDSASGSVEITAADIDTIEVRAQISDGLRRTGEGQEVVGRTLHLRSTCPNFGSDFCRVDYEVRVPADVELDIDTSNGAVSISGTTAPVTVDGDNGSIRLADVSGPVRVSTDNGRVEGTRLRAQQVTADADNGRVQLAFAVPPTAVIVTSSNGRVEVVVPDDGTAYRVDLASDHGRETIAVPIDSSSERAITVRTDHGSATARTG